MAEEEKKEEELELTEVTQEDGSTEEVQNDSSANDENGDTQTQENSNESEEEFVKKDKKPLIKKILIGVIAFLVLILLTGIVLYAIGFFDEPEPEPAPKVKVEKTNQTSNNMQSSQEQEYRFDISDINSKKLNKKLALLTNQHIKKDEAAQELEKLENEKKILEEEKKKHQEAIEQEEQKLSQEKELLEAKKSELEMQKNELQVLKEEALMLKDQLEKDKLALEVLSLEKQNMQDELKNDMVEQEEQMIDSQMNQENELAQNTNMKVNSDNKKEAMIDDNPFLLLINVAKIKGELYKNYLDKVSKINPDISLCRDDKNRIEIYYGPFNSNEQRSALFKKLQENSFNESYEVELTKEEFDKRCKY